MEESLEISPTALSLQLQAARGGWGLWDTHAQVQAIRAWTQAVVRQSPAPRGQPLEAKYSQSCLVSRDRTSTAAALQKAPSLQCYAVLSLRGLRAREGDVELP